jgi:hypothetical protein
MAPNKTTSMIFMTGKVAMKCAAVLKGTGSALSKYKLIMRWTGRNVSRKRPASAITNFLEIEENKILLIVSELIIVCL